MPKCKQCKTPADDLICAPAGKFCTFDCLTKFAQQKRDKDKAKKRKEQRSKDRAAKEKIRSRTGKGGHYERLKTDLHYYVKHCLRKGEPCYTCGKQQRTTDSGGAFHVGHFIPAGSVDPRRFMLENLRIQCYSCNVPNSGMRVEFRQAMIEEMGLEHVEWLECDANHPSLKEKYPDIESIKNETALYRKLARDYKKQKGY